MYGGGQHKERWNKGALQASCKFGQLGRQFIHGYVKTAESQKSSRKNESSGAVAAPGQFLCSVTPPLTLVMLMGGPPSPTRPRTWPCFTSRMSVIGRSDLMPPLML